ncbi:MAG: magnesium transporter CorA family protein [Limosilactobacillus sp.]|jgi:magnesium transporter|uniref:magnesium transporter CorA family protein n=1 Tax=Limosilactobacillus sp. TaxID=2773925 RepID=UPI0025BD99B4|nr:magnesium transporter CorA family protein [Limosilactobacillus sp.]MCI1974437.1 magnesium transporter CorA family protein [Limosilactobacillus sp.]
MLTKYQFSAHGPKKCNTELQECSLIFLSKASQEELNQVAQTFDIDPLTFDYCSSPEEVSRYHLIASNILHDAHILVIYDFNAEKEKIEGQLTPVILIFNQDHLIVCTDKADTCQAQLEEGNSQITDFIVSYILKCQQNLMNALLKYKPEIDRLDAAAQKSFGNDELRHLTNLTRKLVFFEHTMNDQAETVKALLQEPWLKELKEADLPFRLDIQQRRLTKAIHVFRDLLESISGLFTEMMNSSLNKLMKFLDSAGLVIATAALVSGFMGMNVGGLPWKSTQAGFWLTLAISALLAIIIAIYLRRKEY